MKYWKQSAATFGILLTIGAFFYTWQTHPELLRQLQHIQLGYLLLVALLYGIMIYLLVHIYDVTLALCGSSIPRKEQTLLTMYSSIINFFGPLQSGPGVRTVYLKKRHAVPMKRYASATLVYYGIFAGWSGLFLLSGLLPLWVSVLLGVAALFSIGWMIKFLVARLNRFAPLQSVYPTDLHRLALLTFVQVCLVVLIYFVELHAIGEQVSMRQILSYTGAANFSLFVSLTPGALGIREVFLLFSRRVHHISSGAIVSASVVDRGVYVAFLGVLFLVVLGMHAQDRLQLRGDRGD